MKEIDAGLERIMELSSGVDGLELTDDKITFTGFPATTEPDRIQTFMQLSSAMCAMAKKQKRTLARPVNEDNERYIFRIWLLRLGMAGDEYKTARRILLEPLSGSMAFKDQAMEERFKEKQKAKRQQA